MDCLVRGRGGDGGHHGLASGLPASQCRVAAAGAAAAAAAAAHSHCQGRGHLSGLDHHDDSTALTLTTTTTTATTTETSSPGCAPAAPSPSFLTLPLEIRLRVYHWLHLMTPVRHAQLAPWYPSPIHTRNIAVDPHSSNTRSAAGPHNPPSSGASSSSPSSSPLSPSSSSTTAAPSSPPTPGVDTYGPRLHAMLSPDRPLACIPSSLLRTCSQVYYEARGVPFAANEFVYVNWFASGLWPARAFTRALRPWQRDATRWVRLEMMARDLIGGESWRAEWAELCGDWARGLQGLRIKVVLGGVPCAVPAPTPVAAPEPGPPGAGAAGGAGGAGPQTPAAATPQQQQQVWRLVEMSEDSRKGIGAGLARLEKLERVEMELVSREMGDVEKLQWCADLERDLRAGGRPVTVVCVAKVKQTRPLRPTPPPPAPAMTSRERANQEAADAAKEMFASWW